MKWPETWIDAKSNVPTKYIDHKRCLLYKIGRYFVSDNLSGFCKRDSVFVTPRKKKKWPSRGI